MGPGATVGLPVALPIPGRATSSLSDSESSLGRCKLSSVLSAVRLGDDPPASSAASPPPCRPESRLSVDMGELAVDDMVAVGAVVVCSG